MLQGALSVGLTATTSQVVAAKDTAIAWGSGSLPVLATPCVLAWLEATTCAAIEAALAPETSSVGSRVTIDHHRPSAVGATITCTATLGYLDGRLLRFTVAATDGQDRVVASGEISRVVVDVARFTARL